MKKFLEENYINIKKFLEKENYRIIKYFLIFCILPFILIYFLIKYFFKFLLMLRNLYKKHKERKLEKIKQEIIEEIERRYEKFPLKNRFTQEEIIIQDIENEALYVEYLANERHKRLLYLAAIT